MFFRFDLHWRAERWSPSLQILSVVLSKILYFLNFLCFFRTTDTMTEIDHDDFVCPTASLCQYFWRACQLLSLLEAFWTNSRQSIAAFSMKRGIWDLSKTLVDSFWWVTPRTHKMTRTQRSLRERIWGQHNNYFLLYSPSMARSWSDMLHPFPACWHHSTFRMSAIASWRSPSFSQQFQKLQTERILHIKQPAAVFEWPFCRLKFSFSDWASLSGRCRRLLPLLLQDGCLEVSLRNLDEEAAFMLSWRQSVIVSEDVAGPTLYPQWSYYLAKFINAYNRIWWAVQGILRLRSCAKFCTLFEHFLGVM